MKKLISIIFAVALVFSMSSMSFAASKITEKEAINKALKSADLTRDEVKYLEAEYDSEDNVYEVEFMKKANKAEYDFNISASKGTILEKSVDYVYKHNSSRDKIGKLAARKKVAKFSGISLKVIKKGTCRYEYDDNEGVYEVKFRFKGRKYEYDVLAPTGKVIGFEWKRIK